MGGPGTAHNRRCRTARSAIAITAPPWRGAWASRSPAERASSISATRPSIGLSVPRRPDRSGWGAGSAGLAGDIRAGRWPLSTTSMSRSPTDPVCQLTRRCLRTRGWPVWTGRRRRAARSTLLAHPLEQALEDVTLWRFAPALVHGALAAIRSWSARHDDAASDRVRNVVGWEACQVSDPAEGLRGQIDRASPESSTGSPGPTRMPDSKATRSSSARACAVAPANSTCSIRLMEALARGDDAAVEGKHPRASRRLDEGRPCAQGNSDDYRRLSLGPCDRDRRPPAVDGTGTTTSFRGSRPRTHLGVEADGPMAARKTDGETVALDEWRTTGDANRGTRLTTSAGSPANRRRNPRAEHRESGWIHSAKDLPRNSGQTVSPVSAWKAARILARHAAGRSRQIHGQLVVPGTVRQLP